MNKLNIGIIEDEGLFREMLVEIFHSMGEEVKWAVGTVKEGLKKLVEDEPGILVLDMDLPDGEGWGIIEWWLNRNRTGRILVVTGWVESYPVLRLKKSGVMGVVDKLVARPAELRAALDAITANRLYYTELIEGRFNKLVKEPMAYYKCLTSREEELIAYLGSGLTNEEVGTVLKISGLTVQGHRRNILQKLSLRNTSELISWALREGFVKPRQVASRELANERKAISVSPTPEAAMG